jgi:hypothetical protein
MVVETSITPALKYAAMPNWNRTDEFQYIEPLESLIARGMKELKQGYRSCAVCETVSRNGEST